VAVEKMTISNLNALIHHILLKMHAHAVISSALSISQRLMCYLLTIYYIISNPWVHLLELSGQSISCGELQAAGLIGKIAATSCIDILDSSLMAPCQCSTTVMTNEYNTTKPSATPTLLMPTSPPIDLVPSHIPTYTSIMKPSSRPSVPPSLLITTIEPTIAAKVDLPSQRPSSSPSSSTHHDLAITVLSPSSTTTKKPTPSKTPSKNPSSSSLESDLVFSSGNNEGDLLNEDDNSEANAGVGIGMGLLVITPLAILVLGIIYEIRRRQRRRNRNKTVLPLRNTPISKDPVTAHTRQNATRVQNTQNVRSIPTTNEGGKDAVKETTKTLTRVDTGEMSTKCASFVKETKEETANVATSQSIRPQIITSAPTTGKTSASDATEMNEAVTRVDIDRSLKRVSIDKDASVGQEMKNATGGGDSVQNTQIARSIPTTSKASAEAAAETKKAATDVGIASSLDREISVKDAIVVRETNESSDEMSVNSSSSTRSSGSIQSMTSLIIQKSPKNLSAKETKESSASIATQKDHVTRQIAAVVQRTQTQTDRDSSRSTISVGAATEAKEVVAGVDIANRSESEITKGASAEKEMKEATNANATTLPDEVSVNSSSSTQSSESIQSMTSLIIQKSPKSVIAAKDLKKDIDDVDVSSSPDKTRVKNTNSSRIVKKDDAATFFEMLSTLQQFFDCNGDISTDNSPSTSS